MTTDDDRPAAYCFCGCGARIGSNATWARPGDGSGGHDARVFYGIVLRGATIRAWLESHGYEHSDERFAPYRPATAETTVDLLQSRARAWRPE